MLLAVGPSWPAVAAGGSSATVGDASGAKGMANDPNGAIRAMDRSSNGETGPHLMTTVPKLGPSRSDGAGSSRTGGAPAGTAR